MSSVTHKGSTGGLVTLCSTTPVESADDETDEDDDGLADVDNQAASETVHRETPKSDGEKGNAPVSVSCVSSAKEADSRQDKRAEEGVVHAGKGEEVCCQRPEDIGYVQVL